MHIEYIANGMGSQSQAMMVLAARREIPATISITADTGSEPDCLLSDGSRRTAQEFFESIIKPFCKSPAILAQFARVRTKEGIERAPLHDHVELTVNGSVSFIPAFGFNSETGAKSRMPQTCTERFKIKAMRQTLRSLGATSARGAEGLHVKEFIRRGRGNELPSYDRFAMRTTDRKWLTRYYPLVDLGMTREDCENLCREAGLLWVVHSQCEFCPHQDYQRWSERSPASIERSAAMEAEWEGKWFLTDRRIPLLEALAEMEDESVAEHDEGTAAYDPEFGCANALCGI